MKLDDVLGIHERALKLRSRRAEVLAGNIANTDTPGYKARDFDFQKVLKQEVSAAERMTVTHSRHMQTEEGLVPSSRMGYRVPYQPSLDGNTVDAQIEHGAFASNALEYQVSLRFLSGNISKLMTAIKGE